MSALWVPEVRAVSTVGELRSRLVAGVAPGDLRQLPDRVRRALTVAVRVGAPAVPALEAAVAALDDDARRARALRVATAQTRTVAGGLLVLPVLLVPGLGRLLDLDLLAFYTTTGGQLVLVLAAALLALGGVLVAVGLRRATAGDARRRAGGPGPGATLVVGLAAAVLAGPAVAAPAALVAELVRRRGGSSPALPDEVVDLVATALAGGTATSESLRIVAAELPQHGHDLRRLALATELGRDVPSPALARLAAALGQSRTWGAPAVPSLRALATELRADALAEALAAAERLPAQLTFPTALCLLPASVLLVGAPLLADGLTAATGIR